MMGTKFWKGLAESIGVKIAIAGSPMVKVASRAVTEVDVVPLPGRIDVKEASAAGFFKLARNMGWGLYRVDDIDGGLGSIWHIEKAADGSQFLVKQIDPEGEVLRKTASTVYCSNPECNRVAHDKVGGKYYCSAHLPEKSASQRVAVAPPGEEKLVKKLKHDPEVDNPWAVAWSVHNRKKASAACGVCGHGHDGDVCDDCSCRIFVKKAGADGVCEFCKSNVFTSKVKVYSAGALGTHDLCTKCIDKAKKQGAYEGIAKEAAAEGDGGPNPKGSVGQFDRVERASTGAKGIVLKVNDQKPGDIDVLCLWDEEHEGYDVFETDIGDIKRLDEQATPEQVDEAKRILSEHDSAKKKYEDDFQKKIKGGDSDEKEEHAQDEKELQAGARRLQVSAEAIGAVDPSEVKINIETLNTDGGDVTMKSKVKKKAAVE